MPPKTTAGPNPVTVIVAQGGAGDVLCHGPLLDALVETSETIVVLAAHPEMLAGRPDIVLLSLKHQPDWRNDGRRIWAEVRAGNWQIMRWSGPHPYANWSGRDNRKLAQVIGEVHGYSFDLSDATPRYLPTAGELAAANHWLGQFNAPTVIVHRPQTCQGAKAWDVRDWPDLQRVQFLQIGAAGEDRLPWAKSALGMPIRDAAALLFSKHVLGAVLGESVFAHIAAGSPLGKRAVVPFVCTDPAVFGHKENSNLFNSGGCEYWPCNGPLGGLGSVAPGFLNLETGKQMTVWCRQERQLCGPPADVIFETLEETINV